MSTLILAISLMLSMGCAISKDALTFEKSATQQRTRSMATKLEKRLDELQKQFSEHEKQFSEHKNAQQKWNLENDEWWDKPGGVREQLADAFADLKRRATQLEADNNKLRRVLLGLSDQWAETETTIKINKRRS